ncbi:MAG: leucine-rich repeat domain-containing protein [Kiritimatiellae bacterium]|nr:leucine-rich repeat domain-containing protein [Kiritimatiellia bacterium]
MKHFTVLMKLVLLTMTFSMVPHAEAENTWETVNGMTWCYNVFDGKATIMCETPNSYWWFNPAISTTTTGAITIPSSLGGYPVTCIGTRACFGCAGLTSVTIPNSVTSIDSSAFSGCSGLTNVTIGNAVKSIGECAFEGCTGLASVAIPDGVTSIGGWAFDGCNGLKSVTIGGGVTNIGNYAFRCDVLSNVWFKGGVPAGYYYAPFNNVASGARGITRRNTQSNGRR